MTDSPLRYPAEIYITGIDYAKLKTPEAEYLDAVKKDMTFWRA